MEIIFIGLIILFVAVGLLFLWVRGSLQVAFALLTFLKQRNDWVTYVEIQEEIRFAQRRVDYWLRRGVERNWLICRIQGDEFADLVTQAAKDLRLSFPDATFAALEALARKELTAGETELLAEDDMICLYEFRYSYLPRGKGRKRYRRILEIFRPAYA